VKLPLHIQLDNFEVEDNCLCAGGRKLTEIADEVGNTPFYVYDRDSIAGRVRQLRESLPPEISLHYAIKANPMPELVQFLGDMVDGMDVASGGELAVALATGCDPADISFAGPGKSVSELEKAIATGITVNVESRTELDRIVALGNAADRRANVAIRVNPDFELKSSGMKMSGGPKQFGIDAEEVPDLLRKLAQLPVNFRGFHIFSGSQNLRPEAICDSQQKTMALAIDLARHAPCAPAVLNMGGGFGIPYFPGDDHLDLGPIAKNLSSLVTTRDMELPGTELVIELGRYLVGEAGLYVCSIIDKKVSRGEVFLVTDGGLHHHLAASGNFGQVIRKNYPVLIANRIGSDDVEKASVVGPLCTPLDLLADRMELSRAEIGDLVAVFQSGAYGFTASPHRFLGHSPPTEILI
jgi:diaminopimelate decarboxylase